jgi:hypothetical protein
MDGFWGRGLQTREASEQGQIRFDYHVRNIWHPNFTTHFRSAFCPNQAVGAVLHVSCQLCQFQRDVLPPLHPHYLTIDSSILYVQSWAGSAAHTTPPPNPQLCFSGPLFLVPHNKPSAAGAAVLPVLILN